MPEPPSPDAADDALPSTSLAPNLTPQGHLLLAPTPDAPPLPPAVAHRMVKAFAKGTGPGLLHLGAAEVGTPLPPPLAFWREFAARYMTALCTLPDIGERGAAFEVPPPAAGDLEALASSAPPMAGAEYLAPDRLRTLWKDIDEAFRAGLAGSRSPLQEYLRGLNPNAVKLAG